MRAGEETAPTLPAKPAAADADTLFPIPKLTGSIWERERLLGDLGGPRETLAEHGVQLDFTLTQIYQGVMTGGDTTEWARTVGADAVRTLLGELIDLSAERRGELRGQVIGTVKEGLRQRIQTARERVQEIGGEARARFDALPPEVQEELLTRIGEVPPEVWQKLRGQVRDALLSNVASALAARRAAAQSVLDDIVGRIPKLDLGNLGNSRLSPWEYFGTWSGEVKLDTQKMGLWPGGFFFMRVQGDYGQSVNKASGALMPVNTDALFPSPNLSAVTIPHLYLVQFLSEKIGVAVGKLDTMSGDENEFAQYVDGERFLNTAFDFNPVTALTVPYSALGASIILLPTKDLTITATALDGDGTATTSGFGTVFKGKTTYNAEARLTTHLFGLTGHQLIGGIWASGGGYNDMNQNLISFVPRLNVPISAASDTWAVYYNCDQYLWTRPEDSTRGWGLFGRFGAADPRTNPIAQFYSIGVGGKGAFASRPRDRWGIGYYYTKVTDQLPSFLNLRNEQGGEAFYNFAVTPAFTVTADLQLINSARNNVETAVVGGVRAMMRF
jgi:porin